MKKLTITLLLCLCLTGQLFAQMSREDLEVALKYFPAGICGSIAHVDDAALAESKIFNKYRGAFSVKVRVSPVGSSPPSLRVGVLSRSKADSTRLKKFSGDYLVSEESDGYTTIKISEKAKQNIKGEISGMVHFSEKVGDKDVPVILANVASQYRVYRYSNLEAGIKEALKKGEVTLLGKKLKSRPVYSFSFEDHRKKKLDMVAYPTLDNELLVAQRIESLADMLDAGDGSVANLMEEPGYKDVILSLSDNMKVNWSIWLFNSSTKLRLPLMESRGDDPERIALMKKSLECGETYQFDTESFDGKHIKFKQMLTCNYPVEKSFRHEMEDNDGNSLESEYLKITLDKEKNILQIVETHDIKYLQNEIEKKEITKKFKAKREAEKRKKANSDS